MTKSWSHELWNNPPTTGYYFIPYLYKKNNHWLITDHFHIASFQCAASFIGSNTTLDIFHGTTVDRALLCTCAHFRPWGKVNLCLYPNDDPTNPAMNIYDLLIRSLEKHIFSGGLIVIYNGRICNLQQTKQMAKQSAGSLFLIPSDTCLCMNSVWWNYCIPFWVKSHHRSWTKDTLETYVLYISFSKSLAICSSSYHFVPQTNT